MEGSNTCFSNEEGALRFYSNGCYIIGGDHNILDNGNDINPGLVAEYWCPFGGSPIPQGIISLPAPGNSSLAYVFNLDLGLPYLQIDSFTGIAPENLYYNIIDLESNNGFGSVIEKNIVAIQDTFARGTLQAVQHANGIDWWVIVPKSHSNCYFLILVTEGIVHPAIVKCSGSKWNDSDGGQCAFSPDGKTYARFNYQNGLEVFNFDNSSGELTQRKHIDFPDDYFPTTAGVAISSNSQYLYATARNKVYQFDLRTVDIENSKKLIAESEASGSLFNMAALAPDGKIYISARSSHKFLHVINSPNCPGLNSEFQLNGLTLPSFNYLSIPNFPHYRMTPSSNECDTIKSHSKQATSELQFRMYPNPTNGRVMIEFESERTKRWLVITDLIGRNLKTFELENRTTKEIDIGFLEKGTYIVQVHSCLANKTTILIKTE